MSSVMTITDVVQLVGLCGWFLAPWRSFAGCDGACFKLVVFDTWAP